MQYTPNYKPTEQQLQLHSVPLSPKIKTVVFFGGKKAVGKSAAGLAEAFIFAQKYPKAKIAIIGETLDNVKDSFLVKLPTLFPDTAKTDDGEDFKVYRYYEKSHAHYPSRCIVFPNGSYVTFQYCSSITDALAFQGKEFNLIIIDEVTRHVELEVDLIESTLRASVQFDEKGKPYWIPTKLVLLGNPGGIGNDWVLEKLIQPCVVKWANIPKTKIPLVTADYIYEQNIPGRAPVKVIQRFIQGADNPYINSAYLASLVKLPEKFRKAYLDGDWAVIDGKMFNLKPNQKISSRQAREILSRIPHEIYVSIDWGYNPSFHSAHWHAVFPNKSVLTFKELYGQDLIFRKFVEEIVIMSENMTVVGVCLPHDMYRHGDEYTDGKGKIIGEMKSDVFDYFGLPPIPIASGITGIVAERNSKVEDSTKMNLKNGEPQFLVSEDDCPNLVEEMDLAVYDEIKEGHVSRKRKNHAIDSYGHFLMYYSSDISPIISNFTEQEENKMTRLQELMQDDYEDEIEEDDFVIQYYDYM